MFRENVEIVKRFFTSALPVMMSFVHPDAVFCEAPGLSYSGDWVGPEGFRDLIEKINSEYNLATGERWQTVDAGADRVLLLISTRFTSRISGASLDTRIAELYRVEDGLITGDDIFYKDPAAVAALHDVAGLARTP